MNWSEEEGCKLIQEPFPPQAIGCVQTTTCECGWEIVSIMPEEATSYITLLFMHMSEKHGLKLPVFTCRQL